MAFRSRKVLRSKSSIVYCGERYSCTEDNAEAVVECEECGSKQCWFCDQAIHSKKRFHERKNIVLPSNTLLCQNNCKTRNFADVVCLDCDGYVFCHDCFDVKHPIGSKKRNHKREQFSKCFKKNEKIIDGKLQLNVNHQSRNHNSTQPISPKQSEYNHTPDDNSTDYLTCQFDMNHPVNMFEINLDVDNKTPNSQVESLPDIMSNAVLSGENDFKCKGFHLLDQHEVLQVKDADDLTEKLGCNQDELLKVVSIFGNTGDGKSHTLNETFFHGRTIFETSTEQTSCTAGAWAALDTERKAMIIDTEGLLGISTKSAERTRLLLKILAISDIIIYRTRAERLREELYYFLSDAAKAYREHFKKELEDKRNKLDMPVSNLGPVVIIFQETQHTVLLGHERDKTPEQLIRDDLSKLNLSVEGFNSIHYTGTRTKTAPTDFRPLRGKVEQHLNDKSVRSPREPRVIFTALKVLNEKFNGNIDFSPSSFPDQYFTCAERCLSCNARCNRTVNHNGEKHDCDQQTRCRYQHQLENKVYLCKKCVEDNAEDVVVVPKAFSSKESSWLGLANFAWAGYVLECKNCGIIYRSRQFWYGNEDPDKSCVRTEVHHVWPGDNSGLQGSQNAARRLVEGMGYVGDTIAKPARVVRSWVNDQIAPSYWKPDAQITECHKCGTAFNEELSIHHCRRCGEGFCDTCSLKKCPVPERGWGIEPVRVCDECYEKRDGGANVDEVNMREVRPRQVGEVIGNTVGVVASVVSYPLGVLKDSSRPSYWIPDQDITNCVACNQEFGAKLKIHHCRSCGHGVCKYCSTQQREVPSRGWDEPVRVCDTCAEKKGIL